MNPLKPITIDLIVEEDGKLILSDLPIKRGEQVELELRFPNGNSASQKPLPWIGALLASDLPGLWSDRDDLEDSPAFARRLRARALRGT